MTNFERVANYLVEEFEFLGQKQDESLTDTVISFANDSHMVYNMVTGIFTKDDLEVMPIENVGGLTMILGHIKQRA